MNTLLGAVRGFMNVTGSGVLLLLATCLLVSAINTPAVGFKDDGWIGVQVTLAAALFSGFLAVAFWVQREGRRSYHSSAVLNGLSTIAFLCVIMIWWANH
ncbi:hypothetical protein [Dyella sp.]|uniref:hypothetical protein n=1 Tax=Dyella sp. TaxID=1869338 RepID=UPI0028478177|nr:hypothetical protein [Dyella sp.]MDR3447505.1 hypothetical protein [Dyella sp.]